MYFPQAVAQAEDLTLFALQAITDFEQWELERELTLLQVDLEVLWRPFQSLSGGEQTKCLLALLFLEEGKFPLIDEPTNHLDVKARAIVAAYLQKKSGFILVSHDRDFLDATCDHILAIERKQIILYQGNFSTYEQEKALRDQTELAENDKLKQEITRLKGTAREKKNWADQRENVSGATFVDKKVAKKQNVRAKNLEKRMQNEISDKEKLLKNLEKVDDLAMNYQPDFHKVLVSAENFSVGYDQLLFEPVNFELRQGERMIIAGANGTGKSSLIKALMNQFSGSCQGKLKMAQGMQVSYVRQIYDNRGTLQDFALENQLDYELFLSNLRKLGMERRVFSQVIESMSQGQQKKVELAKSLSQPAQLYIWDEPLNYLDVFNHEQIAKIIQAVKPSMIIVEHDGRFIEQIKTAMIELKK